MAEAMMTSSSSPPLPSPPSLLNSSASPFLSALPNLDPAIPVLLPSPNRDGLLHSLSLYALRSSPYSPMSLLAIPLLQCSFASFLITFALTFNSIDLI
jgi:hypothetical protein